MGYLQVGPHKVFNLQFCPGMGGQGLCSSIGDLVGSQQQTVPGVLINSDIIDQGRANISPQTY